MVLHTFKQIFKFTNGFCNHQIPASKQSFKIGTRSSSPSTCQFPNSWTQLICSMIKLYFVELFSPVRNCSPKVHFKFISKKYPNKGEMVIVGGKSKHTYMLYSHSYNSKEGASSNHLTFQGPSQTGHCWQTFLQQLTVEGEEQNGTKEQVCSF